MAATLTAAETPARHCPHPAGSWTAAGGLATCTHCGTRRVLDFRPLAQALELPGRMALYAPTTSGRGHARGVVPYRRRELLRRLREANRRSSAGRT
ncbi:hypothetical protein EKH77_09395 [Streptomyces luteoverticillatus]|uniref:Uncharacterized protein n=1 Tax=Streptomyces luteoverticillatus TaxID=66425 RepID=A0A3S9PGA9_STRLT|nr:DUF6255 family natural product biosynthesis protein [Streptomyces luteoverticillatus]AZQ71392.1 hypothetical protein EKH77_09395 [Streptomyces luteoverticillatus]